MFRGLRVEGLGPESLGFRVLGERAQKKKKKKSDAHSTLDATIVAKIIRLRRIPSSTVAVSSQLSPRSERSCVSTISPGRGRLFLSILSKPREPNIP